MGTPTIVVVAAVIENADRFLVTRRQPGVHLEGMWEFPGGKIDPGETLEQGLLRELREELNWCAKRPQYLYPWFVNDRTTLHLYIVSLDMPVADLELREGIAMALLSPREMQSLKLAPEVREHIDEVVSCMESMAR